MGIKFSQLPITTTVTGSDYIAVLDTTAGVLKRISVSNFGGGGGGVSTFIGTKDEWDDLTEQEKAGYVIVNITDDDPYLIGGHDISGIADGTVSGALIYLNNRVNFKNFIGTVDEWDALTDEEKAVYAASDGATVNFTDDDMPDDIIGDTDISSIGDGTLTGGLASVKSSLTSINSALNNVGKCETILNGTFTTTENHNISLSNYREIVIEAVALGNYFVLKLPVDILIEGQRVYWLPTLYINSSTSAAISFAISETKIKLSSFYENGVSKSSISAVLYGVK